MRSRNSPWDFSVWIYLKFESVVINSLQLVPEIERDCDLSRELLIPGP
jgi:hypothetical protein